MANKRTYLGIDWGTHSAKWASRFAGDGGFLSDMPLYSSDLARTGGSLTFSPDPKTFDEDSLIRSVKGRLIQDPLGQDFWGADRLDTGTSLGAAVTFSLCCLLNDAVSHIEGNIGLGPIDIGFSFPNWLVEPKKAAKAAIENFRQAVEVTVNLLGHVPSNELPQPQRGFPIIRWKDLVDQALARSREEDGDGKTLGIDNMTQLRFSLPTYDTAWSFLVESGAAGLPYLRAMDIETVPGTPGLAKLLVVDVGAGSTDVGYMLRVQHRKTGQENFYYFRPASSFPEAGNVLTDELVKHYSARDEPITYREAEARKLQKTRWADLPFVASWRRRICEHVREYVEGIPDKRWLPLPVPLNIVVTGGSGLVPGLGDAVKDAVVEALDRLHIDQKTRSRVLLSRRHIPNLSFKTEAAYAQRAVCLGASDPEKPGLRYRERMDPPIEMKIQQRPRWV